MTAKNLSNKSKILFLCFEYVNLYSKLTKFLPLNILGPTVPVLTVVAIAEGTAQVPSGHELCHDDEGPCVVIDAHALHLCHVGPIIRKAALSWLLLLSWYKCGDNRKVEHGQEHAGAAACSICFALHPDCTP